MARALLETAPGQLIRHLFGFVLLLVVTIATAETPSRTPGGIGGTGHEQGEGNGIGGTGQPQKPIAKSGTGIVGTITGFGSILVNKFEVDYTAETPAKSDIDEKLDAKALRVGQVVEIEAEGDGTRVRARRISVRYEVVGPIQSIDRQANTAVVLGQTVSIAHAAIETSRRAEEGLREDLAVGDTVQVSGLRRPNGIIVASRVDQTSAGKPAFLRGKVEAADDKGYVVNGVRVENTGMRKGPQPAIGENAAIRGEFTEGRLQATKLTPLPKDTFAGRVERLSIEGYVGRRNGSGRFLSGLDLGSSQAGEFRPGDRVIADGRIGKGGEFIPVKVRQSNLRDALGRQRGSGRNLRPGGRGFRGDHWRSNPWHNRNRRQRPDHGFAGQGPNRRW